MKLDRWWSKVQNAHLCIPYPYIYIYTYDLHNPVSLNHILSIPEVCLSQRWASVSAKNVAGLKEQVWRHKFCHCQPELRPRNYPHWACCWPSSRNRRLVLSRWARDTSSSGAAQSQQVSTSALLGQSVARWFHTSGGFMTLLIGG